METIFAYLGQILSQAILTIIGFYFVFYKKSAEELAKQTVELAFIRQKTHEVEEAKQEFNNNLERFKTDLQGQLARDVEPIKALLNRKNIEFQICTTEYIKLRFQRLDDLYGKMYELQKWIKTNLFAYADEQDFQNKRIEFQRQYQIVEDTFYKASIYMNEDIQVRVIDLLDACFNSMQSFVLYHRSDPAKFDYIYKLQDQALIYSMVERNQRSLEKLYESIERFPGLLRNIESEFKSYLQVKE